MRPWHALLIVIPVLGFLGFRIMNLEDRIGLLHQMVEMQSRSLDAVTPEGGGDEPEEPYEPSAESEPQLDQQSGQQGEAQPEGLEELRERIERLEARLQEGAATGQQGSAIDPATAMANPNRQGKFENYVRSVLRNEADRLRDQQLLKHRDALVENRMRAVTDFAKQAGLTANQEASIASILTEEADRMVELLKQPGVLDEPADALEKWENMLKDTDQQSAEVLNAAQMILYMQLRRLEQEVLMPWLPK